MTLQDLTTKQLDRLYRRLYERVAEMGGMAFGADFRTLRLTRPGLAHDLGRVLAELQARGE